MKSIALIGFMGSGKTVVGKILARKLGMVFFDLDIEIEALEKKTVAEIFAENGEAHFRMREREVLRSLSGGGMVLAVGGGAFTSDDNISLINSRATTVWLDCSLGVCLERCSRTPGQRPLFSDPQKMARFYEHRKKFYKRAHYRIDSSSGEPEEIADQIMEMLSLEGDGESNTAPQS